MSRKPKIGDRVKVCIPKDEPTAIDGIKKYNGSIRVVSFYKRVSTACYYELVGCRSEYGVPYAFADEWLLPIDESEDE